MKCFKNIVLFVLLISCVCVVTSCSHWSESSKPKSLSAVNASGPRVGWDGSSITTVMTAVDGEGVRYIGQTEGKKGTKTDPYNYSKPVWYIMRITEFPDGSQIIQSVNGLVQYISVWNDKATYDYE